MATERLVLGEMTVDLALQVVLRGDDEVRLTRLETDLLRYLAERRGRLVFREELLTEVWGYRPDLSTRAVDNTIRRLRGKLEPEPAEPIYLVGVYGGGYLLSGLEAPAARAELPHRPEDAFLGRDDELTQLGAALARGARLVTLLGPGGAGKSRLALEFLHRAGLQARWVALAGEVPALGLMAALERALGCARADLAEALRHLPGPLVLDQAERRGAELAPLLESWLAQHPRLQVILTSRERLGLPGEQVIRVESLPPTLAVDLFVARSPEGALARGPELASLVAALDGLPLAIEMAAAQSATLSPAGILARLSLDLPAPPGAARPTTLRALIAGSWRGLGAPEQAALSTLALFCGGFTPEAAEAVGAGGHLVALRDRSLLRRWTTPDGAVRLALYETVRAYALERRNERPDPASEGRFLDWAASLARSAPPDRLRDEQDNLAAARRLAAGDARAIPITVVLASILVGYGSHAVALALVEEGEGSAPEGASTLPLVLLRAEILCRLGSPERARPLLDQLVQEADRRVSSVARRLLGELAIQQGRLGEARALLEKALVLQADDPAAEPRTNEALSLCLRFQEQDAVALAVIRRAASGYQAIGDAQGLVRTQSAIATLLEREGRLDEAMHYLRSALATAASLRAPSLRGGLENNLGLLCVRRGDLALGERHYDQALDQYRVAGHRHRQGLVLANLGSLYTQQERWADAEEALTEAFVLCGPTDSRLSGVIEGNRGVLRIHQGRLLEAEATLRRATQGLGDAGYVREQQHYVAHHVVALAWLGRTQEAEDRLRDAAPALQPLCRAHLLAQGGQTEAARALLSEALASPARTEDLWILARLLQRALAHPDLLALGRWLGA